MESDVELSKRIVELAPTAKPPASVKAGALELRPFPWTPEPRASVTTPEASQRRDVAVRSVRTGSFPVPVRASFQIADDAAAQARGAAGSDHGAAGLDMTMMPSIAAEPGLPFRTGVRAAAPLPTPLAEASGETLAIPDNREPEPRPADVGGATLPFDQSGWLSLLRLERYAEMAAQLRADPQRADGIMRDFGLETTEKRTKLHNLWKLRFQANAPLRQSFERLVDEKLGKQ